MISECSDRCIMLHPSQVVSQGWKGLMSAKTVHGFKLQSHYCKLGSLVAQLRSKVAGSTLTTQGWLEKCRKMRNIPLISHDIPFTKVTTWCFFLFALVLFFATTTRDPSSDPKADCTMLQATGARTGTNNGGIFGGE